jgi:hypothetical protein
MNLLGQAGDGAALGRHVCTGAFWSECHRWSGLLDWRCRLTLSGGMLLTNAHTSPLTDGDNVGYSWKANQTCPAIDSAVAHKLALPDGEVTSVAE